MAKVEPNAKNWCFTLHYDGVYESDGTPRPTEAEAVGMVEELQEIANYVVFGFEECPTTKVKHLQGYVQLPTKMRRNQLAKIMPRTHLLVAKGSDEDNFVYCTKGGKFTEFGERRDTTGGRQGAEKERERWSIARKAAMINDLTLVDDQLFVMHYSALKAISKDHMAMPPDASDVTGLWIWGPPGVGKSRKARADFPGAYKKLCNKWWDGYNPAVHENVIMDDMDLVHSVLGYHLKIWCDRYAFVAEVKGGALAVRPKTFVVTSNYSIEQIFGHDEECAKAIRRRCKVVHMDEPFRQLTNPPQAGLPYVAEGMSVSIAPSISGVTFVPPTSEVNTSRVSEKFGRTDTLPLDGTDSTPTRSGTPVPPGAPLKRLHMGALALEDQEEDE